MCNHIVDAIIYSNIYAKRQEFFQRFDIPRGEKKCHKNIDQLFNIPSSSIWPRIGYNYSRSGLFIMHQFKLSNSQTQSMISKKSKFQNNVQSFPYLAEEM